MRENKCMHLYSNMKHIVKFIYSCSHQLVLGLILRTILNPEFAAPPQRTWVSHFFSLFGMYVTSFTTIPLSKCVRKEKKIALKKVINSHFLTEKKLNFNL